MELRSLQSPTVTAISSSLSRVGFIGKPFVHGQVLKFPNFKKYPDATKLKILDFRAQASAKVSSGAVEAIPNKVDMKDEDLAFVAGATGKVGSRTVRELLKLGFRVRAGVRSAQKAETLVKSVQEMKLDGDKGAYNRYSLVFSPAVEKLEIVECDLEKRDQIVPALGNASVVLCCIGASEKEVFDITGPYRIDYQAAKNLIDAATVAKVNHFIMVSSLGTNKVGFPAAILNLFWGVLIWKRKAEEALIASGLPYTIVRPGGMERPTDAYKETHNITLSPEDTLFGGQVSNLQVAELMAFMARNRGLSYCKVVEVIAETTAPLTPFGDLLTKLPSQRVDLYSPKEPDVVGGPDPASSKSVVSKAPSTPIEKEPAKAKAVATTPLSPYFAYDDLKPPTSPTPTPSSGQKDVNVTKSESKNASDAQTSTSGAATGIAGEKPALAEVQITRPLSPYAAYDDFKPPTSPSPIAPNSSPLLASSVDGGSQTAIFSGNNRAQPPAAVKSSDKPHHTEPKPRPLSPFTMYEDLKPPASPVPSPRKY